MNEEKQERAIIVLTPNYQLISEFPTTYGAVRLYAKYNSQDNINNYTSYTLQTRYFLRQWIEVGRWNAGLDGASNGGGYTRFNAGETVLITADRTITHNEDGGSPNKNVSYSFSASFGGGGSKTSTIQMPRIKRAPIITKVNDITDEENPTVYFTNDANMEITAELNYREDGVLTGIARAEKVTSPYTFQIEDSRRDDLRKLMLNKITSKLEIRLLYKLPGTSQILGATTTNINVTIVNAEPSVDLVISETNQKVIDVIGDNSASTIIQNASTLNLTSDVTLLKFATLRSRSYFYNGINKDATELIGIVPTSGLFAVDIKDSRGYPATKSYSANMLEYLPVSIDSYDFEREDATSSNILLSADITYYQATYNEVVNKPTITYKMGENGQVRMLSASDYTIDQTKHKIRITRLKLIDTLVYTDSERFYLGVEDLFTSDKENEVVSKGVPTYEVGEFDFQINGNLYIADIDGKNIKSILDFTHPVGSYYETSDLDFDPNTFWGGTWVLENDGTVLVSKSNVEGSIFNTALESIVGEEKHTQTIEEMPSHTHNITANYGDGFHGGRDGWVATGLNNSQMAGDSFSKSTGGGQPFSIVQPSKVVNRWHRTA